MSEDVFNVFYNCVHVCVGCGFVCFLSIALSLSFPRHEIGIPISCVQSGDAWSDWMMTGGSGSIRSGGSVEKRERFLFARATLPPGCPD